MNNNTTYSNDSFDWQTSALTAQTKIALYSILLVWSLLGNVIVIAVVFGNENLKTNSNYLIVNMAVSDLIIPLIACPLEIVQTASLSSERFYAEWLVEGPLGDALCKLCYFFIFISAFASSFSLVIISFHRFIAVVYPARRQMLSRKKRWIHTSFTWIAAMALFSPDFYILHLTDFDGYKVCVYIWSQLSDSESVPLILVSVQTVVGLLIPLISLIILYSTIQYKLKKNLKNVIGAIDRRAIRSRQQTNRRIFYMSIVIIASFITCWCPIRVLELLMSSYASWFWSLEYETITYMEFAFYYLLYLQTAISPCIYFVFLRDFRQGLKTICCRKPSHAQQNLQIAQPSCTMPTRTRDGDSKQDPTCTTRHINTTIQSRMNMNTRRTRTRGGDSNQDPTCTTRHINTTTV